MCMSSLTQCTMAREVESGKGNKSLPFTSDSCSLFLDEAAAFSETVAAGQLYILQVAVTT